LVNEDGLNDLALEVVDEETSVRPSGFTKGDGSVAEDQVVGAVPGRLGRGRPGCVLFIEIEIDDDLFGEIGVRQLLVELGVVRHKQLGTGEFQEFVTRQGGRGAQRRLVRFGRGRRGGCGGRSGGVGAASLALAFGRVGGDPHASG
jgi:hypothetical protein